MRRNAVLYRVTSIFEERADFIFRVDIQNGPTLRMEAAGPPETVTFYHTTKCHNPEDSTLYQ